MDKKRLQKIELKNNLIILKKLSPDESKQYAGKTSAKELPENIVYKTNSTDVGGYYAEIVDDLTIDEKKYQIELMKLEKINSIRLMLMFFTTLTIIGLVLSVIIFLIGIM